jgi:chromosome segregation ATPase
LVQSILFFVLGFLTAGFVVLLIAPSVWRRAVSVTRQRVEAKLPMTLDEIRADKDSLRAEHAMALRKVEVQLKSAQEKLLTQAVELSRSREAQKAHFTDHAEKDRTVSELEAARGSLSEDIAKRDEQIRALAVQLVEAESMLEKRAQEIEEIGRLYDEASLSSSNRQIELVSRESQIGKLSDDMSTLRNQHKSSDLRLAELEADNKAVREALKAETKRASELDRKLQQMVSSLSDRDDKLERREAELGRLRESELARVREQLKVPQGATEIAAVNGTAQAMERERLEGRLTTLTRENKRLKGELSKAGRSTSSPGEDSQLREQMHELAAEVVALTARLEGADSPIAKALAGSDEVRAPVNGDAPAVISLADRVRALQKPVPAE